MYITNAALMRKLEEIQSQVKEIQARVTSAPAPFAITPVGKLNPDGSITLPDGTKQFPNAPTGPATGQVGAASTPSVPPEFVLGAKVFLKHDPYRRLIPIIHVGDGLVRVALTEELRTWLNASDHQGAFYPSALTLAD